MRHCLLCVLTLCLLACSGPREDPLPRQAVLRWNDVLTVKILQVWEVMQYHVDADPEVTHTIEVEVREGPPRYVGETLFLPYDQWAVGQPPPDKGMVETIMPSQWVTPSRESRGVPHPNWER